MDVNPKSFILIVIINVDLLPNYIYKAFSPIMTFKKSFLSRGLSQFLELL